MKKKIIDYIKKPKYFLLIFDKYNIIRLDDKFFIKLKFERCLSKKIDMDNPKTFNEKLQWLKLYDRKDIYTNMVDKYEAKGYVSKIIGKEYIIPTIGIYNNFDEIDFSKLPNQFVIKCTHDSGGVVICKDKRNFDYNFAKRKINKSMKKNFYYSGREWPYKNVKPRIIIEEYMIDSKFNELRDYKFFCFNGKVKFFKIDFDRFVSHKANYYDINGNILKFGELVCPPDYNKKLSMPLNLKKMIKLSEILSKKIPFVRIDFYEMNGKVFFGEITFFPNSGLGKFIPEEWDEIIGNYLDLPNNK